MGEKRGMKALEAWCRRVVSGYRDVRLDNMTTAWRDGLAFCAVIHHFRPDLIDFDSLSKENIFHNNNLAFSVAEQCLGIPALLDPEDMVKYTVPDKLSIMTYTAQYYQFFHTMEAGLKKTPTKRSLDEKNDSIASLAESPGKRSAITISSSSTSSSTSTTASSAPVPGTIIRRNDVCQACKNRVYILERLIVDNKLYHRTCFKCSKCQAVLNPGSYMEGAQPDQYECHQCPTESDRQTTATARRLGKSQLRPFSEFDAASRAMPAVTAADVTDSGGISNGANAKSSPAPPKPQLATRPLDIATSASRARMEFCANGPDEIVPPTDTGQITPPLSVVVRGDAVVTPVEQIERAAASPTEDNNSVAPSHAQLQITIAAPPSQSSSPHQIRPHKPTPQRIIEMSIEQELKRGRSRDHDDITTTTVTPITLSDVRNNNVADSSNANSSAPPPLPVFATHPSSHHQPPPQSIYDARVTTPPPFDANAAREPTTNNKRKSNIDAPNSVVATSVATTTIATGVVCCDEDGNISHHQSSSSKPVPPQRPSSLLLTTSLNPDKPAAASVLAVTPVPSARKRSTHKEPQNVEPPSVTSSTIEMMNKDGVADSVGSAIHIDADNARQAKPVVTDTTEISELKSDVDFKVDVLAEPDIGDQLEIISQPEISSQLDSKSKPDINSHPAIRSQPNISSQPDTNSQPDINSPLNVSSQPDINSQPDIGSHPNGSVDPEVVFRPDAKIDDAVVVASSVETCVSEIDAPVKDDEIETPVALRSHSNTSTPERTAPVAAPRMRKSKVPEKFEPTATTVGSVIADKAAKIDSNSSEQLPPPPPKPPRHSPTPLAKSARYRPPGTATAKSDGIVVAPMVAPPIPPPSPAKIHYPTDLNPFGDDDDDELGAETPTAEFETTTSSDNRGQVTPSATPSCKVATTPKPPSLNPFGDTDDEDEEPSSAPSLDTSSTTSPRRVIHCDIQSLNPFSSDTETEDEDEQDDRRSLPASSSPAKKAAPLPVPALRATGLAPPRPAARPSLDSRQQASMADETRSLDDSATLRKKRPAPRPPASLHQHTDSASPSPSPRSARKSSVAPSPPTATSAYAQQRHTINPASFRRQLIPSENATVNAADESHQLTEKSLKELDNLNLTRGGALSRTSPERLAPRPAPLPPLLSRSQADLSTISSDVTLSPDSLESHASMQSLSSPSTGSGRGTTFGQWKKKKLAPPVPVPLRRQIEKLPIKEIHVELEEIEEKQCELEKVGVEIEKAIRGNFSDDVEPSVEEEDLILQLFELVNKKNVLFRRQAELTYLKRQHRLEEEHADLEFRIRIMMEKPYSKKTEADISVEEQLIARLVEVVTQRNEIIESMELDRLREAQEDQSIQERLALHRGQRRGSISSQSSSASGTPSVLGKIKSKKKEKKKKHKAKDEDKDTDEAEATTAAKSGGKGKDKKRRWF